MKQLTEEKKGKLQQYVELLLHWNKKINLISDSTVATIWERHIEDSLQLCSYIPKNESIVDLGSGGGLPGIILSIMLENPITLVEVDQRKSIFLREVKRKLGLNCRIVEERVENIRNESFDIITSRALASLLNLFDMSKKIRKPKSQFILLKGESYQEEIKEALKEGWVFEYDLYPSKTSCDGVVLRVHNISREK